MAADREFNDYTCFPVHILPELDCDFSDGQSSAGPLTPEEAPVNLLPELVCDFGPRMTPALCLSLILHTDTPPEQMALDLSRFYAELMLFDEGHNGSGLLMEDAAPANGRLRVTFRPVDPKGAVERFTQLARAINVRNDRSPLPSLHCRSIERCEAESSRPRHEVGNMVGLTEEKVRK